MKTKINTNKPNILYIVVDEWRYPTVYETEELKAWKRKNLKFYEKIASKGTVFENHYTNTTACSPSRTTMQTGHYPCVHGVTQTPGLAKSNDDPEMIWLKPWTVPTMGNYFQEYGYKCVIKGKWHVSYEDIELIDGSVLPSYDANGYPEESYINFYLEKNKLKNYGFDGWIGPEPHGSNPLNSASSVAKNDLGRDVKYTKQLISELDNLNKNKDPWLLLATYVDPHDITLFGLFTTSNTSNWDFECDSTLPQKLFTDDFNLSIHETLETKPVAQKNYVNMYPKVFQPIIDIDKYHRYYYTLQKRVDKNIMRLYKKLKSLDCYKNTIIVFTSDHGDQLGSHGRMYQKWYQAYQESIKVPLIISSPLFHNKHRKVTSLTSHIDLLPTLLDLCHADINSLRLSLGKKTCTHPPFSLNLPTPGNVITPLILGKCDKLTNSIYFYTKDDPISGQNQINNLGKIYCSIDKPCYVEAVLCINKDILWKLTHYYSDDNTNYDTICYELYNITNDPLELTNLYDQPKYKQVYLYLLNMMQNYRVKYQGV